MKEYYVILTPFFPSEENFAGSFIYDQVKAIQNVSDYEVIVIKPFNSGTEQSYTYQEISVHQIKLLDLPSFFLPGLFNKINYQKIVNRLIELTDNRLDTIKFIHGHVTYPFGILASQLAIKIGTVSIVQHHGFDVMGYTNGRFQNKWIRKLNKYWINHFHVPFLNCANWNIGVSQKTLDELNAIPGYKPTREYVLYNGINRQKFYPTEGQRDVNKFTIGCVANFWPIKDQLTLIKAVQHLKDENLYTNIHLKFIGSGSTLAFCKHFVDTHNLQSNVEFLATQDHTKMNIFYNSLDLFVLPSYYEAYGCVYTEACVCGVPFIGVEGQGIEELVSKENRQYQLIKPADAKDLSEKIKYFFNHRNFKPQLNRDIDINILIKDFIYTLEAFNKK